ncbi:MAG TPA: nucleoside hydrolase [Clostridia bacterium]
MRFIIDTDIGDDIDDAFAIDMALNLKLDLVGITTVYMNTDQRTRIAKRMLDLYGIDIPVYKGYGCNMDGKKPTDQQLCQFSQAIMSDCYRPNSDPQDAVDFILYNARKYGKDLTIIAIGPLTNIAKAVLQDKAAMQGIGKIVIMGGDYKNQYSEWNILCDIDAAKIVFEADLPMVCFGHELTSRTQITQTQQDYIFKMDSSPYLEYLSELSRLWYASKKTGHLIILHDVLTVYCMYDKDYCKTVKTLVKIEDKGEITKGMTVNLSVMDHYDLRKAHMIEYAVCDNVETFKDIFYKLLKERKVGSDDYEKAIN